ncbi:MAG: DUF748 domain-containing protein, partial [Geobacteraceae bacterium]|nr:DUF748 domain-containing protein [Geobacteraceae bacterium]
MTRKNKILLISLASVAALLIFIITILPLIVRNQAVAAIERETGRKASIEKIAINPFTLTVTVNGCAIKDKDGGPFISIGRLRASLSLASLYRRALILSEVSIDAPAISFARLAANNYSFNDIIELQKAKPQKESKGGLSFSINNISITNGSLDFDDQAIAGGRKHTIRNLKIAIPFISNIPFLVEKYTDPHISALVNGAPFNFQGKVKPLSKSMETSVHIDLKQLSLPEYIAYLPVRPPADLMSGKLGINCDLTYRVSKDKKPELGIKGRIVLDTIAVNLRNGQPLLRLPSFQVTASDLDVFAKRFLFDAITIDGLELFASRNAKGVWMYNQLLPTTPEGKKSEPAADSKQAHPPLVQVTSLAVNNGSIHFSDAQPAGGFKSEISQIDAAVRNFSTAEGATAEYECSLLMDNEATFNVDGNFSLSPLSASVSSELSGMKIQRAWPYLSRYLTAPLKGTVELSSELSFSKELGLTVEQGSLLVTGFSARYGAKEGFDLARFEIKDAGYSQKKNTAEIGEIRLSKGDLALSREVDGTLSALSLLKLHPAKSAVKRTSADSPQNRPTTPKFTFRLKKLQLEKFNAAFTDKTLEDKPHFTLHNTSLSLTNLNGPQFTPARLRFASIFNKATPLKANGDITPLPFRYKGRISIGRLPLRDFEAYFPDNINVIILDGFADADMHVDIALKNNKPVGSFEGDAGIRAFHAIDTEAEEDLLKWESLQLDDIQGNLEPFRLSLRQIALNG